MVSLRFLGGASLYGDDGPLTGPPAQRHRLALLALLAGSPTRAVTRDRLMAILWPERDRRHARKLLNQSLYVLRGAIGRDAILSVGEEVQLDTGRVHCDVVAFDEALEAGNRERAAALFTGPFLDGFHLGGSPEFERWADGERVRLASVYGRALEDLAEAAAARGELAAVAAWWGERWAHDPYDSRVALRLMKALVRVGNPAGALQRADEHQRLLREDLRIGPAEEVAAFAERLRRGLDPTSTGDEGRVTRRWPGSTSS